jgi:hypothetical protein
MFLIGAGCSVSAGVPLAAQVALKATIGLAGVYGLPTSPPASALDEQRAKIALEALIAAERFPSRFLPADGLPRWGEVYSYIFSEHIKHPDEQRALITQLVTTSGMHLNWSHACLGELVSQRFVHTVLTTNFDQLVLKGIIRTGIVPVVADGLESLTRISPTPQFPQVVHLHGSMHTYEIRNSHEALRETANHSGLRSMMLSILKETTVLVVVGYSGGEEGVMRLLQEAARDLPRMVVYWIAYDSDYARLSPRCREFLETGEYKFFILNQNSDDFFNQLLGELECNPPAWVKNPLDVLTSQARIMTSSDVSEDVAELIRSYEERLRFAKEHGVMTDTPESKAIELRSGKKFLRAAMTIEALPDYKKSEKALRIHAVSMYKFYKRKPDEQRKILDGAISELELLVDIGTQAVTDTEFLIEARRDLYESLTEEDPQRTEIAEAILKSASAAQSEAGVTGRSRSLMEFYKAEASQLLAEQLKRGTSGTASNRKARRRKLLRASRMSYADALPGLSLRDAERARECKEGWAGALSGQAELEVRRTIALSHLREAKALFEEVVDSALRNTPGAVSAGALENLAGVVEDTAKRYPEEAENARNEERTLLRSALAIYVEVDDSDGARRVQERLDLLPRA